MLSSQNAFDHARHHGWCLDALISEWSRPPPAGCSFVRMHQTIDVIIMAGPRMLCAQNALDHGRDHAPTCMLCCQIAADHGRYHGWAMDALLSDCSRPLTLSWLGHGCSLVRLQQTMDVIMVGPWMLFCQTASGHGRYHGWAVYALCSERIRPWTLSWLVPGCFVALLSKMHQTMEVIMVGCSGLTTH